MNNQRSGALSPAGALRSQRAYSVPRNLAPVDLRLDGNEGIAAAPELLDALALIRREAIRQYPSPATFERALARHLGLSPERVLVTAGADDALDRTCRAMLEPGKSLLVATPTFEMIPRYARLAGAEVRRVSWGDDEPYPVDDVLASIDASTTLIALVTPNNPTGQVIAEETLARIARAAPHALIVVDHAYIEFSPANDLTDAALAMENVVVVRTMSKAWGLAGLRVGYVMGHARVIDWLRAAGNPYAVSGPSQALARARLELGEEDIVAFCQRVADERAQIADALARIGARPTRGEANFCFARYHDSVWLRDLLASQGIAVRAWPEHAELGDAVRVSCPGDDTQLARLLGALETLRPEAILFDMDGVLVDVSTSYRQAILQTCARFGADVSSEDVAEAKRAGDANNDWVLTQRLLATRGIEASLADVTEVFEELYQGTTEEPGLRATERPLVTREWLEQVARRARIAVVTGRPRRDAEDFIEAASFQGLFEEMICMEDATAKPSAGPVIEAMRRLGVTRAWMIGDTPDDIRAARAASERADLQVAAFGVLAPGEGDRVASRAALVAAGAGRVFDETLELIERI